MITTLCTYFWLELCSVFSLQGNDISCYLFSDIFLFFFVRFCIVFRLVLSFFVVDSDRGGAGYGCCIAGWFGLPTVSYFYSFVYSFCHFLNSTRSIFSSSPLLYSTYQFLACRLPRKQSFAVSSKVIPVHKNTIYIPTYLSSSLLLVAAKGEPMVNTRELLLFSGA